MRKKKKMALFKQIVSSISLFLLFVSLLFLLAAPSFGESSNVKILTDENFEHLTQASTGMTTGDWFIEFYAEWCNACKQLAPTWELLAKQLAGKINVGKVNINDEKGLNKRFSIQRYPTLLYFRNGYVHTYNGEDTRLETLKKFALQKHEEDGEAGGMPVPSVPTLIDGIIFLLHDVLMKIDRIYNFSPIAFFSIFFVGMLSSSILLLFAWLLFGKRKKCASSNSSRKVQSKKKD